MCARLTYFMMYTFSASSITNEDYIKMNAMDSSSGNNTHTRARACVCYSCFVFALSLDWK